MIDPDVPLAVGLAGFHYAPDAAGMVEHGYRIDAAFHRRGYARRALETLLAVVRQQPEVSVVRATISSDNTVSRALVSGYDFVEVGEQWHDEDGLDIIFAVASSG